MTNLKLFRKMNDGIKSYYALHTTNNIERVSLTMYLMGMIMATGSVFIHLSGLFGLADLRMQAFSWGYLAIILTCSTMFLTQRWPLIRTFCIYGIASQLLESVRIIMLVIWYPSGGAEAMLGNLIISYTLLLYVTMGFVPIAPIVMTALYVVSTSIAYFLGQGGDTFPGRLFLLFALVEAFTCLLAYIIRKSVHAMQRESTGRQVIIDDLRNTLGLSTEDMNAFLRLHNDTDQREKAASYFFNHIDSQSEERIVNAVQMHLLDKSLRDRPLTERFPMLTPTEVSVTRLVMEGLSLKQIGIKLHKSESNVGSVRVNIRKKLGLNPDQDLKEYLYNS